MTSLLSGVQSAFSPKLWVFCLREGALLVIGFVSACMLATTFEISIRCNTTIRPESVHYVLVACGVKYVRLLATTLDIAVHCNTTIRL